MRDPVSLVSPVGLILSGTAHVVMYDEKDQPVKVADLRSGEVFGLSDLLRITVSDI